MERATLSVECPAANFCNVANAKAPPCHAPQNFPPEVVAEQLCPRALASKINKEAAGSSASPIEDGTKKVSLSWFEFERGLAESDPAASNAHFAASEQHANQVLDNPYTWFKTQLPILVRQAYRQAFLDRKQGKAVDEPALTTIRQGLAQAYSALQAAPVHTTSKRHLSNAHLRAETHTPCFPVEGERTGLVYKVVGLMLSARQPQTLLYPSSPREYAPSKQIPLRHDGYRLLADGQKVPVKLMGVRPSLTHDHPGNFDELVQYINLKALLRKASTTLTERHPEYAKSSLSKTPLDIAEVGRFLRDETEGHELDRPTALLLDELSAQLEKALKKPAPLDGSWAIQPTDLLTPSPYRTAKDEEAHLTVPRAVELYLRHGDSVPSREDFQLLISKMRESEKPGTRMACIGAYY